jgi:branched-chain amino acid transport system substrate-binding protein
LDTQLSRAFVARYQARFGQDRVPGVYTEVTYSQVHIFANALRLCPDGDTDALLGILSGAVFHGPRGDIYSDVDTNHFTVRPLIGSSQSDGTFKIVWKGPSAIKADPYLVAYDRSV